MEMEIVFGGGKKVNAIYKNFTIKTDQPRYDGGDNSAPAPFDLFLASIGTCSGYYVLSFCQGRDIPTDGIKIILRTEKGKEKIIDKIKIEIQLPPEFPEKYRDAVIRAVELCAVKRCIQNPPSFEIYTKKT